MEAAHFNALCPSWQLHELRLIEGDGVDELVCCGSWCGEEEMEGGEVIEASQTPENAWRKLMLMVLSCTWWSTVILRSAYGTLKPGQAIDYLQCCHGLAMLQHNGISEHHSVQATAILQAQCGKDLLDVEFHGFSATEPPLLVGQGGDTVLPHMGGCGWVCNLQGIGAIEDSQGEHEGTLKINLSRTARALLPIPANA